MQYPETEMFLLSWCRWMKLQDQGLFRAQCWVGGDWIGVGVTPVRDPASGVEIARVPVLGAVEVDAAVASARGALAGWSALTGKARGAVLRRWADLLLEHCEDLANILTAEQGKPLAEARAEIVSAASYFEFFAEEARRVGGELIQAPRSDSRIMVRHKAIGVVAAITPWNFPASMVARKLAPALAAGCTIVLKPAPETPLTALAMAELGQRAGLPQGALNVVTGEAAVIGAVLTGHADVTMISFTGSTQIGRLLAAQSAPTIKKLGLELGGHAPFVVLADADLDAAVAGAFGAKYRNMGQTCVCPNRFFVHETLHAEFLMRLADQVAALVVGDGRDPASTQGPLINMLAVEKVERHVADAVAQGGTLLAGGSRHQLGGTYFEPTIIDGVTDVMLLAQEETFGPVAAVTAFSDLEAVVSSVNASPYGLAGYVYGRDISTVLTLAERLDYGMVGINAVHLGLEVAPIGGLKQSGLGREGSHHGLLDYCEMQYLLLGI